jgi:hypothetical protein
LVGILLFSDDEVPLYCRPPSSKPPRLPLAHRTAAVRLPISRPAFFGYPSKRPRRRLG